MCSWIHVVWAILRQNWSRGVTSRSVGEKKSESHRGSHRNDMSPLTQGLNYRSACDTTCKALFERQNSVMQMMTWLTWFLITLSDYFKMCDIRISTTSTMPVMYPASRETPLSTPLSSNTARVSNTCIKTLLLCSCRPVPPSAPCTLLRIDDPARWTADSWRRCCCSTENGLTAI